MKLAAQIFLLSIIALAAVGCGKEERTEDYFLRGMTLYEKGDLVKAKLEFRNVLQIDPKYARAWFMIGRIEESQQNWKGAFGAYGKAAEIDPANLEARTKRGELLLAGGGSPEEALSEAEAVLAAEPGNADALVLRGMVRARQGEADAAVADANRALEAAPTHRSALTLLARIMVDQGRLDQASALLEQGIAAHPDDVALREFLAGVYDTQGDSGRAIEKLEEIVALKPGNLSHRVRLAGYLNAQGNASAAEQTLRTAVEAIPGGAEAKLALISFLNETKGLDAAVRELRRFIDAAPKDQAMRFALAELYFKADKPGEAETIYREIMVLEGAGPEGLRARSRLGVLLLATDRTEEAEEVVADVLARDADDAEALVVRAAIALQRGEADRAIGDLRRVVRDNPESAAAWRLLGRAHLLRDEVELAGDTLEKAIEAAPMDPTGYFQLAGFFQKRGETESALKTLNRLLARLPDNLEALSAIARIQLDQQDMAGLEQTVDQLVRLDRENPLGTYLKGRLLEREGELGGSVEQFEAALSKSPTAVEPLIAVARNYVAQGQPEKAESRLRIVLSDDPENLLAINLLGDVYVASKRFPEARNQYAEAIRRRPKSPLAYERLAALQARDGDTAVALETLRSGVEATGNDSVLSFRLAALLGQTGDHSAAADVYEEMLERDPQAKGVRNNLAMLLVTYRSDDSQSLQRASELAAGLEDSENANYLDTAGWVQFKNGNFERALGLLEKAASLGQPSPELLYHLGMVYLKLGRAAESKEQLSAAVGASTPFPGIDVAREALEGL